MKHNPQPDTKATRAPKPRVYHLWAGKTEEAFHTYCGRVQVRSRSRTYTRPEVEASDMTECKTCTEMRLLDENLNAELQRELRVLKRYEVMLDALRELEEQEGQR